MSAKKGKKKNKPGVEPKVLVNTSALFSLQSPANSIASLTEMFGDKIDIEVIRLVFTECDNDVNQAAESLASIVDSDCNPTKDDSYLQEIQSFSSISESTADVFPQSNVEMQNSSFYPNSLTKSFASSLNSKLAEPINPETSGFSASALSSPIKHFSKESSYLSSSPLKLLANKTAKKKSVEIQHICTIINTLKYDELKKYVPGFVHEEKCDRIINNINLGLPVLIILRGLPGSGKSFLASVLKGNGVVYSTDDYFCINGSYSFNPNILPEAHDWNRLRTKQALVSNISPIIIDNTNLMVWEMSNYVSMGLKHNYIVEIIEPATSWKFKPSELSKRNIHCVPKKGIEAMLTKYQNADIVCNSLRRNKFASIFVYPFAGLKKEHSKLNSKDSFNSFEKLNACSKTENFGNTIPKPCSTPINQLKQSEKVKNFPGQNQPTKSSLLKLEQVLQQNNFNTMFGSLGIEANSHKKKKTNAKCITETVKNDSKSDFNPLMKHPSFKKEESLCKQMECLQLNLDEKISLPSVECAGNNLPCSSLSLNEKLDNPFSMKSVNDKSNSSVVEPKISTELDKCDPDSSESEISIDVRSESETNYSQSVSSWKTSSEDVSESENSEKPDEEVISSWKKNFRADTEKRLNNERDLNPVFPKPPRKKPISTPLGNMMLINNKSSEKLEDLEVFSESWDTCAVTSSDNECTGVDDPKPKPRRETWKQIEKSSHILSSPENKSSIPTGVEIGKQESEFINKPYSLLKITEKQTELEIKEKIVPLNVTEKSVGGNIEHIECPKPVELSNLNMGISSPSKLSHDTPASSSESSKYIGPNWEFPRPYSLTPPPLSRENIAVPKKQNRRPLIIGADKYLGKNWDLSDCLTSHTINPEIIFNKDSQITNSIQISSETQTESKDFIYIDQIVKSHTKSQELKESVYKIIFANVYPSRLGEKENISKKLREQSFSPKSNNQFDASTNTEEYSVDIADDQKNAYIKECFPDLTVEEIQTYLGLCQGDVQWAINIIIENGHISQNSKKERDFSEEKNSSLLNCSFKSISLESIPAMSGLSSLETPPLDNSKNWYSDDILFKTPVKTPSLISRGEYVTVEKEAFDDIKTEKRESSSEENSLKSSDKIILTLSLEDAQELQYRYGPVVENKALSTSANREIALDPELVYSLWMSTQSLKESDEDLCRRSKNRKKKSKPRKTLFPETSSESNRITSNPQTLSEIMDMEYALKIDEEEKLKKDTLFIKEKRLELYSLYPGMDRRYLDAVFDSNNYNVQESKFCIDGTYAMIENDSKAAAASLITSEFKKSKHDTADLEEPLAFMSPSSEKSHLGIAKSSSKETIQKTHELALSELAAKREMSSKAVKAYHSKMAGVAAYYAEKAREHHWNANEHFNAICESIKADAKTYELDLHGCYVREGLKLLQQFLNHHEHRMNNWPEKDYPKLTIVTGFGKHSERGPVLHPSVSKFLKQKKYLFSTNTSYSVFYVTLKRLEENGKRK